MFVLVKILQGLSLHNANIWGPLKFSKASFKLAKFPVVIQCTLKNS